MPKGVKNCGYHHNRGSTEAACNMVDASLLVLDVQVDFL
jgi:hypothetical protein